MIAPEGVLTSLTVHHPSGRPVDAALCLDGAKHAFAHVLAAAALAESFELDHVPDHLDARALRRATETTFSGTYRSQSYRAVARPADSGVFIDAPLAAASRSTFCLLPALLVHNQRVWLADLPRGCDIGSRPTTAYFEVLRAWGVDVRHHEDRLELVWVKRSPASFTFSYPMMTGSVIALSLAAATPGLSTIANISSEPSVAHQLRCLRRMGARIEQEGTTVRIWGRQIYEKATSTIGPDRIHAATYLTVPLLIGGTLRVKGHGPLEMPEYLSFLKRLGVPYGADSDTIEVGPVDPERPLPALRVVAGSEPLFSSDWLPFATLALALRGTAGSVLADCVFSERLQFLRSLYALGLHNHAPSSLDEAEWRTACTVASTFEGRLAGGRIPGLADIRGSAALALAGVVARDPITIEDASPISRGYEAFGRDLLRMGIDHVT